MTKRHETPSEAGFIIAFKNFSNKTIVRFNFQNLKNTENFQNKNEFYSSYKKFWVVGNYFPIIGKLNVINTVKRLNKPSAYHNTP